MVSHYSRGNPALQFKRLTNELSLRLSSCVLQTALHWGAKHGDENIVKLIAGTYRDSIKSVNETTVSVLSLSC